MTYSLDTIKLSVGARCLDLPCGYGRHAVMLAGHGCRVVAADIDAVAIGSLGGIDRLVARVLDVEAKLPFENDTFDLVIVCDFVLPGLIRRLARVVKPSGWLIYTTYSARGLNGLLLPVVGHTAAECQGLWQIVKLNERKARVTQGRTAVVDLLAQRYETRPSPREDRD